MRKSRTELASDLFTLRASIPLWRKTLGGDDDLLSVYDEHSRRVLSWTADEDREWVTAQLDDLMQSASRASAAQSVGSTPERDARQGDH